MLKKIFWIVSFLALVYVLLMDNEPSISSRNPAGVSDDYTPNEGKIYAFNVNHCSFHISSIKELSGQELSRTVQEMTKIRKDTGTSVENKDNVFYPINNCVSVFLSNSIMQAQAFRKSVEK